MGAAAVNEDSDACMVDIAEEAESFWGREAGEGVKADVRGRGEKSGAGERLGSGRKEEATGESGGESEGLSGLSGLSGSAISKRTRPLQRWVALHLSSQL